MNYRNDLINNILPFWLKDAIDYKNGGIYTCLDKEGNIYGTDKSVWFQGRALWVFSKAYNCIDKNEEYLKAAKNIYSFLEKCTDTDGRMFFTVTEDGTIIPDINLTKKVQEIEQYIRENNIGLLSLVLNINGQTIKDDLGESLSYKDFYSQMREGAMPTTSQVKVFSSFTRLARNTVYLDSYSA